MDINKIISALTDRLHQYYEIDESHTKNGFDIKKIPHLWCYYPVRSSKAGFTACIYLNEIETEENKIFLHTMYWTKYGQVKIKKNKAIAGWNVEIPANKVGIPLNMEIVFEEKDIYNTLIHFDIFYAGAVARTTYLIDTFGDVSFYGYGSDDMLVYEGNKYYGTLSEGISRMLSSGIEEIATQIKVYIEQAIETENLLL